MHPSLLAAARRYLPRAVRNAVRHPIPTIRWAIDKAAERFGATTTVRMADDWGVNCTRSSAISFQLFLADPETAAELARFVRHLTPGAVLIDAGAHYGAFTLAALHYAGPGARVIAIEPSPLAARVLGRNVNLSSSAAQVQVVEAALGDHEGTLEMLSTGAFSAFFFVPASESRSDSVSVRLTTLEKVARASETQVTHVKIDVEGFEEEVLRGALPWLAEQKPVVFLELHGDLIRGRGADPWQPLRLLETAGYRFLDLHDSTLDCDAAVQKSIVRMTCLAR